MVRRKRHHPDWRVVARPRADTHPRTDLPTTHAHHAPTRPPPPPGGAFARLHTAEDRAFIRRVLELDGRAVAVASDATPRELVYVGKSEREAERLEEHETGPLVSLLGCLRW